MATQTATISIAHVARQVNGIRARQCDECKVFLDENNNIIPEPEHYDYISHGKCRKCFDKMMREIDQINTGGSM